MAEATRPERMLCSGLHVAGREPKNKLTNGSAAEVLRRIRLKDIYPWRASDFITASTSATIGRLRYEGIEKLKKQRRGKIPTSGKDNWSESGAVSELDSGRAAPKGSHNPSKKPVARGPSFRYSQEPVVGHSHHYSEFHQFAVDAGCTPTGILPAHLADQISDLARNDRVQVAASHFHVRTNESRPMPSYYAYDSFLA